MAMPKINTIITKRTMQTIDSEIVTNWLKLMKYTSVYEIHKKKKISRTAITELLESCKGTQSTIDGVTSYFNDFKIPSK